MTTWAELTSSKNFVVVNEKFLIWHEKFRLITIVLDKISVQLETDQSCQVNDTVENFEF